MTASKYLLIFAIGLGVIECGARVHAEGDVTIYTPPPAVTNAPPEMALAPDGTPVVHKSLHKKKNSSSGTVAASTVGTAVPLTGTKPAATAPSMASVPAMTSSASVKTTQSVYVSPAPHPAQTISVTPAKTSGSFGPPVETGLPVARHGHGDDTATAVDPPIPLSATLPAITSASAAAIVHPPSLSNSHPAASTQVAMSNTIPAIPGVVSEASPSKQYVSEPDDYVPTSVVRKGPKNSYPWKTNIITTVFWIGESGSAISSTNNIGSAWDEDWRDTNGGSDSPNDRNGYASGRHAAMVNPFYVALPFNDLAFPDKAQRWLPRGWYRAPKNGRQVSACKDRWVEIKIEDGTGRVCYAQWEDVGPLRYDHAEYVFGPERPDTYTRAGLDVSPAVAQYLRIDGKNRITRWRFVDDEDVPPGLWLKYEEQAVIFKAIHDLKNAPSMLPIEAARAPVDDSSNIDSNKKKVGAAKG